MGDRRVPFVIVYTKIDKLSTKLVDTHVKAIQDGLLQYWNALPDQFITSSEKKVGRQEILHYIGELNNNF
jgi:GTP-binding protein